MRPTHIRDKKMNRLDLDAYGVSAMTKEEMVETNGGLVGLGIIIMGPAGSVIAEVVKEMQ